jgi:hypothetical protein
MACDHTGKEDDMRTHQILTSAAMAGLLAVSIPAYAGGLTGVGGGFGGRVGAGMSSFGGFNSTAMGSAHGAFAAQVRQPRNISSNVAAKGAAATSVATRQTASAAKQTVGAAKQTGDAAERTTDRTARTAASSVSASTGAEAAGNVDVRKANVAAATSGQLNGSVSTSRPASAATDASVSASAAH